LLRLIAELQSASTQGTRRRVGQCLRSLPGKVDEMPRMTAFIALAMLAALLGASSATAQASSQEEMRSLDEQVQEIKSDVLGIARDLTLLEERLLYPSNTQLAVFVGLESTDDFRLDAVRLEIDGELVAHYIYSFKELEALQNGGVQRVYTGNVMTGAHDLTVAVSGMLDNGREITGSETFTFDKGVDPELLGLTLSARAGAAAIELGNW
jgi:hypothetical protein